jgi:CRISPR-associated endonuclease Csn1
MKKILGLDLGTNSIGWALVNKAEGYQEKNEILAMGSRIIPMTEDVLGKFDNGITESSTAERTGYRGIRRLRERALLRRERLHRVLNVLGFLPKYYAESIDFEKRLGQFIGESEPKIAYQFNAETKRYEFVFQESFQEMLADFAIHQPELVANGKKVPFDWTLYYLRKKALTHKIDKEELAWLILNFNQKRGYYQLRGEDEEVIDEDNKLVEFYSLKVVDVIDLKEKNAKKQDLYKIILENGWEFIKPSAFPVEWKGKTKDFIITTSIDKTGNEKRSFRAPDENDWTLLKKKTESTIDKSGKTVGTYIFDTLLKQPNQKIKGKLVRTIERKFYKDELKAILNKQKEFHKELQDQSIYQACVNELYPNNDSHCQNILNKDFTYLFVDDILFYQRPLKSKKSLISNCRYEKRFHKDKEGKYIWEPLKCIAKSHPLFQEFRLWQWLKNLKLIELSSGNDITQLFLNSEDDYVKLFEWLNERKEIDQESLLKKLLESHDLKSKAAAAEAKKYRWNYVYDSIKDKSKPYPCNETRAQILSKLSKCENVPDGFLSQEKEISLWHILYSVEDKHEIEKALKTFARKNGLGEDFVEQFKKFPRLNKEYGSYSEKAIKKLLPLMRIGKYWGVKENKDLVWKNVHEYQKNIEIVIGTAKKRLSEKSDEYSKVLSTKLIDELANLNDDLDAYKGLPLHIACYAVYGQHSEEGEIKKWYTSSDLANYLDPKQDGSFKQHSLRNPIVEQVVTETLRVVKDIWEYYGQGKEDFFDEIHIELGREMKNTAEDRKAMTQKISENETTNLRLKALLAELKNDKSIENVRPHSPSQHEILKIYEEGIINSVNEIPEDILKIQKSSNPTSSELTRYKLWLEQGYVSPYTGEIIPLNKLFSPAYEIEHIIPQSRFFDDSLSNKVICETEVNKLKGNMLGLEFVKECGTQIVELPFNKKVRIKSEDEYIEHITRYFAKNKSKLMKLKLEDIPEKFAERQMNDTRYISKIVKNLLSNIVRDADEDQTTSKKVIPMAGGVTSILRQDWGLNDVWNDIILPRFERLNELTNSQNFTAYSEKHQKFIPNMPLELQKGFQKKRIDHRHHALDALVIACATRNHINYLNNQNAIGKKNNSEKQKQREDLKRLLCFKRYEDGAAEKYQWIFIKPWESFTTDAKEKLSTLVVSFKKNTRILNKTSNRYQKWINQEGSLIKDFVKQKSGSNWAIRKPLHQETVYGAVTLHRKKTVSLNIALDDATSIVDKSLRYKIRELVDYGYDKKKILKYFKDLENKWEQKDISKVEVYYLTIDNNGKPEFVASRNSLDNTFNRKRIEEVTDSGIQKILLNHLSRYDVIKDGKIEEHPELAFSPDGIDTMNQNIVTLNGGKYHQPIYKVRLLSAMGNKFAVGERGNKKDKYVIAAKGTNLFFGIYQDEQGKRSYETIPLNIVIERLKQGLTEVPETNEAGNKLLFYLSPNDLVYMPSEIDKNNLSMINFKNLSQEQIKGIYKIVSFTDKRLYAIPNAVSNSIVDKVEFTQLNKIEFSVENKDNTGKIVELRKSIKEHCIKLQVDRLGNIKPFNTPIRSYPSDSGNLLQANEPASQYNLPITFLASQQLEEKDIQYINSLTNEQRFEYLNELRKTLHNLNLSEEEKKALLNKIIINPPNEH